MRNVMVCTVGTSLKANLAGASGTLFPKLLSKPNIQGLVLELSTLDPGERIAGAEINSITSILKKDKNESQHRGLKPYLQRIRQIPYVIRIYVYYYNPRLPLKNYFRPSSKGDVSQIEGGFSDGKATTKFDVVTTAQSAGQQNAALVDLLSFAV